MMFVVKNLIASRVNLLMNDFAAGLPSPLAFLGLADTVVRRAKLEPWSAGVLPILHSVSVSDGRTKPEMESKSGIFKPIETLEDLTGTVAFSMLLDLPGLESAAQLRQMLPSLKLAGGIIQNVSFEANQVEAVVRDGSALRSFHRGFAMVCPDSPERRITSTGDAESLAAVIGAIFPAERRPGSGWVVPVAVGHHLIENPATVTHRSGKRDPSVPHVFSEPLLGIAEMVSVRNSDLTGATPDKLAARLWRWHSSGSHVVGHHNYHPENLPKTKAA
jgi:hypothetical protein